MKRLLPVLLFLALVNACKKSENPVPLEISDARLQDYHIISIAFDPSGTAWLGTLSQGLIRHSGTNIAVFDSTNSILNKPPSGTLKSIKKEMSGLEPML